MKTILVVDDDPNIATALSIRLKDAAYQVVTAADGEKALKLARETWPDLIIMDIGLPLMDIWMPLGVGFSVVRRLKPMGMGGIPIIFITAGKQALLREMAQDLKAVGFFEKPYEPEELLKAVNDVLKPTMDKASGPTNPPLPSELRGPIPERTNHPLPEAGPRG